MLHFGLRLGLAGLAIRDEERATTISESACSVPQEVSPADTW